MAVADTALSLSSRSTRREPALDELPEGRSDVDVPAGDVDSHD